MSRRLAFWAFAAGAIALALLALIWVLPPRLVESRVRSEAQARGFRASVASSVVRWNGVLLRDVRLHPDSVPGMVIRIPGLLVHWNRTVQLPKVLVRANGSADVLLPHVKNWWKVHKPKSFSAAKDSPSQSKRVSVGAVDMVWEGWRGPGSLIELSGARKFQAADGLHFSIPRLRVRGPQAEVSGSQVELVAAKRAGEWRLSQARARTLEARVTLGSEQATTSPKKDESPQTRPLVVLAKPQSSSRPVPPHASSSTPLRAGRPAPSTPRGAFPLRDKIVRLRERLGSLVARTPVLLGTDAKLAVDAASVLVTTSAGEIRLGPGKLEAHQSDDALDISLRPDATARPDTDLSHHVKHLASQMAPDGAISRPTGGVVFDLHLPRHGLGMRWQVKGGPVPLASLGVREGDMGLVQVSKTRVFSDMNIRLDDGASELSLDGTVHLTGLGIRHPKLAPRPVVGLDLSAKLRGKVHLENGSVHLDEAEVDLGKVGLRLEGELNLVHPLDDIDVRFHVPPTACGDLLAALPASLAPKVQGMRARGSVSLRGALHFVRGPKREFSFSYTSQDSCRYSAVPTAIRTDRFTHPFVLHAYDAKGRPMEWRTGPGTEHWTDLAAISRYMEVAVMTTEDAAFRRHRGFDHEAIRNSVRDNLFAKRFRRGASTISMQLAKNLFLTREKTVARKIQELILTDYLEQVLTKDRILELYLNVIEFAPGLYGIRDAASHYFHTTPGALSLSQALYLSSILPNPKRQHFVAGGRVSQGWMNYLYKLMRLAARRGWIDDEELQEGLNEWVVFGRPEPERLGGTEEHQGDADDNDGAGPDDEQHGTGGNDPTFVY